MITVYGIPNCDTVKKALTWLDEHKIKYVFHNYKKDGIDEATIKTWLQQQPLDVIVNKKGSTYKNLDEAAQKKLASEKTAVKILIENTSAIKRPIVNKKGVITAGFSTELYEQVFLK
jgi:arsenate reductase (glutaredoxin)